MNTGIVSDQHTAIIPGDAAFLAPRPMMASVFLQRQGVLRQLYEALYDSRMPGQASQTISQDATEEQRRSQDHSGNVGGCGHGAFLGMSRNCGLVGRAPVIPFTLTGWADPSGDNLSVLYNGESTPAPAPGRALVCILEQSTDIIYMGHCPLRLRRGTNTLEVATEAWQVSPAGVTAGTMHLALLSADWGTCLGNTSHTLATTPLLNTLPNVTVYGSSLDVAADGATLTETTEVNLVYGFRSLDTSAAVKSMFLFSAAACEKQL